MTAEQYPADSTLNISFLYDQISVQGESSVAIGRLSSVLRSSGNIYYVYDARGNLAADLHDINGTSYTSRYRYNVASQLTSMTYPSGRVVNYQRDSLGRIALISVQADANSTAVTLLSNATYRPFGPLSGFLYGNGVQHTQAYDLDGRLINILDAGAATVQSLAYGYDWAGNISSLDDNHSSNNSQLFSYDDMSRLIGADGAYGVQDFTYDSVGNRTSFSAVTPQATLLDTLTIAGTSNRVESLQRDDNGTVNGSTFAYDAAGNTTSSVQHALTYNAANRLSSATLGATTIEFDYNALGQRVAKYPTATPTNAVHFHYDQRDQLIGETTSAGAAQRDYVWLDSTPVAILDGTPQSTQTYYVHNNHLKAPQLLTDDSAAVVWQGEYEPFGTVDVSVATVENHLRFPGQYFDAETGLHYNYFRDYDPALGRYVESDPIGLQGGINTYAYVEANPINYADPLGLMTTCFSVKCSIPLGTGGGGSSAAGGAAGAAAGVAGAILNERRRNEDRSEPRQERCNSQELDICAAQCGGAGKVNACHVITRWRTRVVDSNGAPLDRRERSSPNCDCDDDCP